MVSLRSGALGIVAAAIMLVAVAVTEAAVSFPRPQGAVNDFAGVIPPDTQEVMENLAREVLAKTGTALVVATMDTIGEESVDDYANRLYEAWGIGKKGEDRGVLIFLAVGERKIRVETGYGVEGILPDGRVGEILDGDVIPYLREGDYGTGLLSGMRAVAAVLAQNAGVTLSGAYTRESAPPEREQPGRRGGRLPLVILLLVLLPLLATRQGRSLLALLLLSQMSGGWRGGGGFGGFGGGGFGGFGGGSSGGGGASRGF